jgi:undecaprenyl-diphosphatase
VASVSVPSRSAIGVALAAVAGSYLAVRTGRAERFDRALERLRRPLGHRADVTLGAATDLGSIYALIGTAGVLAAAGRRRAALDVAGAGATAWALGQAAKPLADRRRPYEADELAAERLVAVPAGSSWPSGHSAVAAAVGTTVAGHARSRPAGLAAGTGLAAFVGLSRIYVGVHHPSDSVAGAGIGVLSAALWRGVRRRFVRD